MAAERVGQGRGADELQGGVALRRPGGSWTCVGDVAVVDERRGRRRGPARACARSGWRVVASTVAPRSLATVIAARPTEEVPPRTSRVCPCEQVEAGGQGAVGGLQGLRHRADDLPREVRGERNDLVARHDGVLGVAAVEDASHAAHQGGHLLAGDEVSVGGGVDDADGFDAEHPGEGDAFGVPEPGVQLGPVQPEGHHLDPHPARERLGDGQVADVEVLHRPGGVEHHRAHRVDHRCSPARLPRPVVRRS